MKLHYIEEYLKLAETLNFSKTAEIMYITQPVLSRHIAIVEAEMGAKLLQRNTRHVVLTEAGKVAYENFTAMLTQYHIALEQIKLLTSGQLGSLKISSPYYYTSDFTEPIVERFSLAYPKCDVHILSCQPIEGLKSLLTGNSDLFLTTNTGLTANSELRQIPFASEILAVLLPSMHPLANQSFINPTDLVNETFIFLDNNAGYRDFNAEILSIFVRFGISPKKTIFTQQVDTLGLAIRKTGGISIMPYSVRHMDRDYIKTIPLIGHEFIVKMCLYYRYDNPNPLIHNFIQTAIKTFQNKEES